MHQQFVIEMKDLRFAAIRCRHCNTRVVLDMEVEVERGAQKRFVTPRQCPYCASPFDSAIPKAMDDLQKAYKALAEVEGAVSFEADRP